VESDNTNLVNNPVNNPIASRKRHRAAVDTARDTLTQLGAQHVLDEDGVAAARDHALRFSTYKIVDDRLVESSEAGTRPLDSIMMDEHIMSYVGCTRRLVEHEAYRWLTERGANGKPASGKKGASFRMSSRLKSEIFTWCWCAASRNRPVLQLSAGNERTLGMGEKTRVVTEKLAKDSLKFETLVLYQSAVCFNAYQVEESIQREFQDRLPLGRRLWRHCAMGQKTEGTNVETDKVYTVFLTYSVRSARHMVNEGFIVTVQ